MVDDDPFGTGSDDDRTRLVPRPGGSRMRGQASSAPTPPRPVVPGQVFEAFSSAVGINALLTAATPLLVLLTRLTETVSHPDPDGLRAQIAEEVKAFGDRATAKGIPNDDVFVARYVLCTALDEVALHTPWGAASDWPQDSLLVRFHGEADGGDKFFSLLDSSNRDPGRNLPLLELMYTCLSLGFQGRYRMHPDGQNRLAEIREQLYQTLRRLRERPERELSPHWHGVTERQNVLVRHVPLWVVAAVGLGLLLALYWFFSTSLNQRSDPVALALSAVEGKQVIVRAEPERRLAPAPPPELSILPTLRELLAEDIAAGRVEVIDVGANVVIRLRGDGLFASGRAAVKSSLDPTLDRIAAALDLVPGPILVTGHTDSVPIRTIRFPSNFHLSQARADSVASKLSSKLVSPGRLAAKGRAHNERLENPDDTRGKRARNRRVEILVSRRPVAGSGAGQ